MTRSKLGPMSDDDFQHDIPNIPDADKAYSPAFHDRMRRLSNRVAQTRAGVQKAFDPNQPREPKGSPEGGQWSGGSAGSIRERTESAVAEAYAKLFPNPLNERQIGFANKEQSAVVMMELIPNDEGIYVQWLMASPHKAGMGTRGMDYLKRLATKHNVGLSLTPWEHGELGKRRLTGIFKKWGFAPGSNGLLWWYPENYEKFDPNQPRAPKGSPTGGQWVDVDTGSTGKPLGELLDEKTKQGVMDAVKKVVVFHGTTQEALESILEKGLIPDSGTRGADAWVSVADPDMYAMMMLDQSSRFPDRKASVFVTGSPQVAEGYARFAMDVNQGSDGVVFKIEVPVNAGGFREDEFSQGGNGALLSLRRVGGIPREWIKQYKIVGEPQFSIVDGVYGVEKANRTLYAVIICKPDVKKREDGFFDELLESDDEAVERVIDKTKKRMKARGLSQEAIDLAYDKPKK